MVKDGINLRNWRKCDIPVYHDYRKKEEEARRRLLENPIKMKQLQKVVRSFIFKMHQELTFKFH